MIDLMKLIGRIFIIIIVLALFVSCDDALTADSDKYEQFFPLEVGNSWSFTELGNPDSISVVYSAMDKKKFNGIEFTAVGIFNIYPDSIPHTQDLLVKYFAVDNSSLLQLEMENNQFKIKKIGDFALDEGDRLSYELHSMTYEVLVSYKDENTITFSYNTDKYEDEEFSYTFEYKRGLVKIRRAWRTLALVEYELN